MLKQILNIIFPPKCIFCGAELVINSEFDACPNCYKSIEFFNNDINSTNKYVFSSRYYDDVVCACKYEGLIKVAFTKFKFSNKPSYYRFFSKILSEQLKLNESFKKIDIIVNVPMYTKRKEERGYNQSELIARAVGKLLGITHNKNILIKLKDTVRQSSLDKKSRALNVKGVYHVKYPLEIQGKIILLLDDILTTGSTLEECSMVLKEAGALRVIAAVVASGRRR